MNEAVAAAALQSELRGYWLAYPNLKEAAEKTLDLLSSRWPSSGGGRGAAVTAIVKGLQRVAEGIREQESTRKLVVSNFLDGLGSVAEEVAKFHAWGFSGGRPVHQYEISKGSFRQWAHGHDFDEIRFYFRPETPPDEVQGTRVKFLCAVASTRDVGTALRFR